MNFQPGQRVQMIYANGYIAKGTLIECITNKGKINEIVNDKSNNHTHHWRVKTDHALHDQIWSEKRILKINENK